MGTVNKDTIEIIWHVEDIIGCAEGMGMKISLEKAREVLQFIHDTHDASIGVNWDVIRCALEGVSDEDRF
jgi:hypothetical protein